MLILSRKIGESIIINDNIEIIITEVSGDKIKVGINAPREIPVFRKEIIETQKSNKTAVDAVNKTQFSRLVAALHKKL